MAKLTIAEQDERFNKYNQLDNEKRTELIYAMMEPYWVQTVPRERMERMRSTVIVAIILGLCDKFEDHMVSAWASIAVTFVPPFNDEDIKLVKKLAKTDEEYAGTAVYIAYYAHVVNPSKYTDEKKELPMPRQFSANTLLNASNVHLRASIYNLLETIPGLRYFHDDLDKFALENKMTAEEDARYQLIRSKIDKLKKPQATGIDIDRTPVTAERSQYIRDMANSEWVHRLPEGTSDRKFRSVEKKMNEEMDEFLVSCKSPAELHHFVLCYNWDMGLGRMLSVVKNQVCDRNTALLIFWRGSPTYYQLFDYRDVQNGQCDEKGWNLVTEIKRRIHQGLHCREKMMPEDYKKETREQSVNPKWEIHDIMYGR